MFRPRPKAISPRARSVCLIVGHGSGGIIRLNIAVIVVCLEFGDEEATCFKWLQHGDLALWWCPLILVQKNNNMFQVVATWRPCIMVVSLDFGGKNNRFQVVAKWRSCIMVVSLNFGGKSNMFQVLQNEDLALWWCPLSLVETATWFKWLQNGDLALWWCPLNLVLKKQHASSGCKMEILHYGGVP